jgi:hypothetical protein
VRCWNHVGAFAVKKASPSSPTPATIPERHPDVNPHHSAPHTCPRRMSDYRKNTQQSFRRSNTNMHKCRHGHGKRTDLRIFGCSALRDFSTPHELNACVTLCIKHTGRQRERNAFSPCFVCFCSHTKRQWKNSSTRTGAAQQPTCSLVCTRVHTHKHTHIWRMCIARRDYRIVLKIFMGTMRPF